MVLKCPACGVAISRTKPGVSCADCNNEYHFQCGKINKAIIADINSGAVRWRCIQCQNDPNLNSSTICTGNKSDTECEDFSSSLKNIEEEINRIKSTQMSFNNSISNISSKLTQLNKIATEVSENRRKIESLEDENRDLKEKLIIQERRISRLERLETANQIIIKNIPTKESENLRTIFNKIKLNLKDVPIEDHDVFEIFRKPMKKPLCTNHDVNTMDSPFNRNTPIIVKLKSQHSRDIFLAAARSNPHIKISQLGFNVDNLDSLVIINEVLCFSDTILYSQAKAHKETHNFKYLWTKHGKIFMRKDDATRIYKTTNFFDLSKVI